MGFIELKFKIHLSKKLFFNTMNFSCQICEIILSGYFIDVRSFETFLTLNIFSSGMNNQIGF